HVQPNRPELVMGRLAHFHPRHPINNFARIEVAEYSALEFQKQRWMQGVTQVEQRVWPSKSIEQFAFRHSNALDCVEIVLAQRILVVEQAITFAEPVRAELSPEVVDLAPIVARISFARHVFEPDRVEL